MQLRTFGINNKIGYKEIEVGSRIINKIYEINNQGCEKIVTIPDGCIDMEFVYKDHHIDCMVCGSHLAGTFSEVGNYDYCFGIKFHPGVIPEMIQMNLSEIVGERVLLDNVRHIEQVKTGLFLSSSFENKVDYFTDLFQSDSKITSEYDITEYMLEQIDASYGAVNIAHLVDQLGYSQCYVNRIFKSMLGFSIKKYADIVRLQESLKLVNSGREEDVYDRLGYYDQAHFIKSFKKFTTFTPKQFQDMKQQIVFV